MQKYKFLFGQRAKCEMTGVEGNIDGLVLWNNGSHQYSINTGVKADGEAGSSHWTDWQDFEAVEGGCKQRSIKPEWEFEFGDKISISNNPFIGFVVGMALWSNGCARYMVRSKDLNKGSVVSEWFSSVEMNKIRVPDTRTKPRNKRSSLGGPSSSSKSARI